MSGNMKSLTPSKIIGIQFSVLSPEEIRNASVAEITNRESYTNNKPVIGGLFDPRMGVLEPGLICPTDGLDYIKTPGYFGHIELAKPVFYIQYLAVIQKILRCVCFKCSKLLISKEKYSQALKMEGEHRWKYVFGIASKVKRCGDDISDGCGCLQPNKLRKEGLATLFAEWKSDDGKQIVIKLTAEMVLKILKRISDEDVTFMGFSATWSRPDWMICQVMAVPPPAVRPSVKHDAQQRSEDDLTHILVSIIKTNKILQEKIQTNAPANVVEDWTTVLQYYIATQVDNKIPGVASVAQRSGRPLKSIKDRLNGKGGRMRGNLMAKRVDFSARSVITADPNISISELGIPMKIAKNLTRPIVVNDMNKMFLKKLVENGPDIHPGAKILEKKNGDSITLRYVDKRTINLENGDIVHRHIMNGDPVLFNRQPTLHRMSMMCHRAKIMKQGDTFRLNVAATKPYNADFDGDEMNLHMPQDTESDSELMNLAAVPYQIISPANNKPIVGIYQDSMLGCYRFTRENINFTPRQAMKLLMMFPRVNENLFAKNREGLISSFEVLSQIFPPISMKYKTSLYRENEEHQDNNVLEIENGEYLRGQLEKGVLGSSSKGLIHRICNDYGNLASGNFIDDLQNIVTEYLNTSAFSVGISDLLSDSKTNEEIIKVIGKKKNDVKDIIDQTQIGVFENKTGKTNEEEFETQVNNILNQATAESGKIGLNSLDKDNRFVTMVNAGSKGSDLNISFMISCLGQQNVDGKRIPYGFDHRTLPHYTKYDDSPGARGFVESSYINGLSPEELFFHAMGGRVGLIDTAVKTSTTGYIQRRLIKGLEDLMVSYDMTVRNNKAKLIQFSYGDDSIDPVKVEGQSLPLVTMNIQQIYEYNNLPNDKSTSKIMKAIFEEKALIKQKKEMKKIQEKCKEYTDYMVRERDNLIKHVFKYKNNSSVNSPVAFKHIINNITGQQNINANSVVDLTLLDAYNMIEESYTILESIRCAPPTELFKVLYNYYLAPKDLLYNKRFNKAALTILLETIIVNYKRAIVAPGEMVGMIAAQSIGEPTTQMTLNTFHFAGVASKSNVTRGVPRIEEILSLSSEPKNPSLTVYLNEPDDRDKDKALAVMSMLEHTKLGDLVASIEICFDPDDSSSVNGEDQLIIDQYRNFENMINECAEKEVQSLEEVYPERSKWILRMEMRPDVMLEKNITMDDVNYTLNNSYRNEISCVYSDYNSDNLIFRIRMNSVKQNKGINKINPLDQTDEIYMLKNFQDSLLNNIVLRGIKNIGKVILRTIKDNVHLVDGNYKQEDIWVLDTVGSNLLDVLSLDYIDSRKTFTNNIIEVYNILGIEAAREAIYNELVDVIEFDSTYINYHHLSLLCDRMTYTNKLISIFRHGINNDNIGPIAKASFEETPEMFLKAARHGELDMMRGVSANIMCGQEGLFGTNSFQVVLNMDEMQKLEEEIRDDDDDMEDEEYLQQTGDTCDTSNLIIENNVTNVKIHDTGEGDDDYNPGF